MDIPVKARYRKKPRRFGAPDVKNDESIPDLSTATECYNFDCSTGALREGFGVAASETVPSEARRYWSFKYYSEEAGAYVDQYIYQIENGRIMYYDSYTLKNKYLTPLMLGPVTAIQYRLKSDDVIFFASKERGLLVWSGSGVREYNAAPHIKSMALHYERLFVTSYDDPTKLFFSDDLDPTNWNVSENAAGFIELLDERGALNKVVSFGNYLYVFREHGISRLTAFADQSEFSVINLFVSAGRIYEDSIAVCGSFIIFAASDGLYAFDGYSCTRIMKSLDRLLNTAVYKSSAYFDGKYYLSFCTEFGDGAQIGCEAGEHSANALLVYDVAHGEISVSRGLDISYLGVAYYLGEDTLFACESGRGGVMAHNGMRFDEPLRKVWKSALADFGTPDKTKTLRELYIDTDVPLTLTLDNGKRKKTVKVKSGNRRVRANMTVKRVRIEIETDAPTCRIRVPTVIYS